MAYKTPYITQFGAMVLDVRRLPFFRFPAYFSCLFATNSISSIQFGFRNSLMTCSYRIRILMPIPPSGGYRYWTL
jgi:hypothetical protein